MTVLTVWKFDSAAGAGEALERLKKLQKNHQVEFQGLAVVEWPQGKKKPNSRQDENMTKLGAFSGASWGILLGLVFFIPFFGLAAGAAMGALAGHFIDYYGFDDDFIESVRDQVTEGTSALFLFTSDTSVDKLQDEFKDLVGTLIKTNLNKEQEDQLRKDFGIE